MSAGGVVTKYYRRLSGDLQPSPLHSTWFKENIIADQRFERRRRQIPAQRKSDICYMDTSSPDTDNVRLVKRARRQSDCRICNTELRDWSTMTSPTVCSHLFHEQCYEYWLSRGKHNHGTCPICVYEKKMQRLYTDTQPTIPSHPLPVLLRSSSHPLPRLTCSPTPSSSNSLKACSTLSLIPSIPLHLKTVVNEDKLGNIGAKIPELESVVVTSLV